MAAIARGSLQQILRQFTGGQPVLLSAPDLLGGLQTTDGSLATALTVPIEDNTVVCLGVRWKARQAGGSANILLKDATVAISRVNGGPAAIVSGSLIVGTNLLPASWGGGSIAVAGNDALLQVQGLAATTANWVVKAWVEQEPLP